MIRVFTSKTQKIGEKGEEEAVVFLIKQGFKIIDRNIPNKFGEIDIVGKKGSSHYFFEVKAGKKEGSINPAENLHLEKIRKFIKSVEYYCLLNKVKDYRVQAIIVLFSREGETYFEILDLF